MRTLARAGELAWFKSSAGTHPLYGYEQLPYLGMRYTDPKGGPATLIERAVNETPTRVEWTFQRTRANWLLAPSRLFDEMDEPGDFQKVAHAITTNDQDFCTAALSDLDDMISRLEQLTPQPSIEAPDSQARWSSLTEPTLESIRRYDAGQLSLELARVSPRIREKITDPVYSLRNMFSTWERLVRRMEAGWQNEGQYPISAYANDLDSRDQLQAAMSALPDAAQAELSSLLRVLDERFLGQTELDAIGELGPWLKPSSGEDRHGFWLRKPRVIPW